MRNYDELKKSEVKDYARSLGVSEVLPLFVEHFGEANVRQVGYGAIAVCSGLRTLADGRTQAEVCTELNFIAKDYEPRVTSGGNVIEAYEKDVLGDNFDEKREADEKAAKEKREKEEKRQQLIIAAKEKAKKKKENE